MSSGSCSGCPGTASRVVANDGMNERTTWSAGRLAAVARSGRVAMLAWWGLRVTRRIEPSCSALVLCGISVSSHQYITDSTAGMGSDACLEKRVRV